MYCTSCGAQTGDQRFCTSCGARVVQTTAARTANQAMAPLTAPTPSKGKHSATVIVGGAVAAALVVGGVIFIKNRSSEPVIAAAPIATQDVASQPATSGPGEAATRTPIPVVPAANGSEVVRELYVAWENHDQATVNSLVVPSMQDKFATSFLTGNGFSVSTTIDSAEPYGGGERVCGTQTFTRRDGETQQEKRCFVVKPVNGQNMVTWSDESPEVVTRFDE